MSKTVDQRVVEMRFDNQQFERNVSTTLSTLDKLKQSLNLTGATKGLDNLNAAARKNEIGVIGTAAEAVGNKFSAMEIVGITALVNLTNTAINTGKKITNALMITPIKSGFNEYELKMGSIQTIMAGTGESLDTVNKYLNELNKYSDQTIYSFQDMTTNIGKFTNAGVKLKDAVAAIKGVSNEAALSGANANEASRAMYNFAQALSTGSVKLIDWKSIENANMATVSFKEELIKTAVELGTVVKKGNMYVSTTTNAQGSVSDAFNSTKKFNDSLQHQWMTSKVLIETLKKYSDTTTEVGKKATKAATEVKTFSMMWDTVKEAAQSGWATSWEIIFGDFNEGKKLWTSMANSIGAVVDKMSDVRNTFLKGVFWEPWKIAAEQVQEAGISIAQFRKDLLATAGVSYKAGKSLTAFNKALKQGKITREVIIKTLKSYTNAGKSSSKTTEDLTAKLKKFQKIVDKVWRGDFGNGQKRVEALTKAGYKYSEVQSLVNKCVNGYRLKLSDLNSTQLKSIGYTNSQIKKIKALAKEAETAGTDFNTLIENLSKPSGRELILETVSHLAKQFSTILEKIKESWVDIFGTGNKSDKMYGIIEVIHELVTAFEVTEEQAKNFKSIMDGVFTTVKLGWSVAGWGIISTMKLINAVLSLFGTDLLKVAARVADLITQFGVWAEKNTIWWGYINNLAKIVYELVDGIYSCTKAILSLNVVSKTIQKIFNAITKFLTGGEIKDFSNHIEFVATLIRNFFDNLEKRILSLNNKKISFRFDIQRLSDALKLFKKYIPSLEDIKNAIEKIQEKLKEFMSWLSKNSDAGVFEIGKQIINGLTSGIKSGTKTVIKVAKDFCNTLIEAFKKFLEIHSPSKIFIAIGGFIVAGLIYGIQNSATFLNTSVHSLVANAFEIAGDAIQNGIPFIVELVKTFASKILEGFKDSEIDLGAMLVVGTMITVAYFIKKILNMLDKLTSIASPITALSGVLNGVTGVLKQFQKNIQAKRMMIYAEALRSVAISLGLLVGSFLLLSKIDSQKIWPTLGLFTAIILEMSVVMFAASKLGPIETGKLSILILAMSASLILITTAIKKISAINPKTALVSIGLFALILTALSGILIVYGTFVRGKAATNIDKAGVMIAKMALTIGVVALVMKLISTLSPGDISKGLFCVTAISAIFGVLIAITKNSGRHGDRAAKLIGKMGIAIALIAVSVKIFGTMSMGEITKGIVMLTAIGVLFTAVIAVSKLAGSEGHKAGLMFIGMSFAIGIIAVSIKMIAGLSIGEIQKGLTVITNISKLFAAFIIMSNFVGPNAAKAGRMMLGISAAIAIMVLTIKVINTISNKELAKGMTVIAGFQVMLIALITVSKFAGEYADKAGTMLMKMSLSILVLVGAIALLSIIKPERVAMATEAITSLMKCFVALMVASALSDWNSSGFIKNIAVMVGVVYALVGVIAILSYLDPTGVVRSASAISIALISLSASMAVLSKVQVDYRAVGTVALFSLVLYELAGVFILLSKLNVKPTISIAASLVILLGGIIGACYLMSGLGAIAGPALLGVAIVGAVIAALPTIGKYLSDFWDEASVFIDGIKGVRKDTAIGMKNLAEALFILTGAGFLEILTSKITGTSSLTAFSEDLKTFGIAIKEFAIEVKDINGESIKGVAEATKILVELADSIPNSGGFLAVIAGDNTLDMFGSQLKTFGTGIKDFAKEVEGVKADDLKGIVNVAKTLSEMIGHLPTNGGAWSKIVGEVTLEEFGEQLGGVGTGLNSFVNNLGIITDDDVSSVKNASKIIKAMIKSGEGINGQSEFGKLWFGDNGIDTFSTKLPAVGANLSQFASNLGTFSEEKIASINSAIKVIKMFGKFDGANLSNLKIYLPGIGNSLPGFASNIKNFSSDMPNKESIDNAITNAKSVISLTSDISKVNTESMNSFKDALYSMCVNGINVFVNTFNGPITQSRVANTIGAFIDKIVSEVRAKKLSLNNVFIELINSAISAIRLKYNKFYEAGSYVVEGFCSGIKDNYDKIRDAANDIGRTAIEATTKTLDEHSPSRAFFKIGDYAGLGFVNGLGRYTDKSYDVSANLAEHAKQGLARAVDKVRMFLDSGIETNPTITPVLDLSDVTDGVRTMNSMLDMGANIGVSATASNVNYMMGRRIQNGPNQDVISAINKLGAALGNVGGDTYTIDGITYDDGTNVSNAVKSLIRAAKIERRV